MPQSAAWVDPPCRAARSTLPNDRSADRPPVDLTRLRRFTLGNLPLEQEILGLYATQAPIMLAALRRADTPTAWFAAGHTLKGSSASIGAWLVADAAEQAELLVEQRDKWDSARQDVAEAIQASLAYLARVQADLSADSAQMEAAE